MTEATTFKMHLRRGGDGRVELREGVGPAVVAPSAPVPSRLARLVGLAHRIDRLVRSGDVRDYAEVALLAGITRARVSQICDLLLLAPDLQERLLFMDRAAAGRELLGEHHIRRVVREPDWVRQREAFERLTHQSTVPHRAAAR